MPNPVCIPCQKEYKRQVNGVYALEETEDGHPYKLWLTDVWKCEGCGHELLCGYGNQPVGQHFHGDFADQVTEAITHNVQRGLDGLFKF